jgi:hypothetical protein
MAEASSTDLGGVVLVEELELACCGRCNDKGNVNMDAWGMKFIKEKKRIPRSNQSI